MSRDLAKVSCHCPSCGHDTMFVAVCEEHEPSIGQIGFYCRGCGAEWDVADMEEMVADWQAALVVAEECFDAMFNNGAGI